MAKNAIELLKQDHDNVRKLLQQLGETGDRAEKKRLELLDRIAAELSLHTRLEEEIFYPAFREADGKAHEKMYFEAREEHRAVESLVLPDLQNTDPGSDCFGGRAKVLKELVEHHAEEEEEEMFPQAEKALSSDQLEELGQRMAERRKELAREL